MTELPPPPADIEPTSFRRDLKDAQIVVLAATDGPDARELIRIAQACEDEVATLLGPLPASSPSLLLQLDPEAPSSRQAGKLVWNSRQLAAINEYQFLQPILFQLLARRCQGAPPAWLEAALAHRLRFPRFNFASRRQSFAFSAWALRKGVLRDASEILNPRIDPASYWVYRLHADLADAVLSYTCSDNPSRLKLSKALESSGGAGAATLIRELLAQRSREEAPARQLAACLDSACYDSANPRPPADFMARFRTASGVAALGVDAEGRRGLVSRPVEDLVEAGKTLDAPARQAVLGSLASLNAECPYELRSDFLAYLAAVEKLPRPKELAACREARSRLDEAARRLQASYDWLDQLGSGLPPERRLPELFEAQQRWQQERQERHRAEELWLDELEEKSRSKRR